MPQDLVLDSNSYGEKSDPRGVWSLSITGRRSREDIGVVWRGF
jgi:hypothetical protein